MPHARAKKPKPITVHAVVYDDEARGPGPAGDYTHTYRTQDKEAAEKFAAENTRWGGPCTVHTDEDVPLRIAKRWGFA